MSIKDLVHEMVEKLVQRELTGGVVDDLVQDAIANEFDVVQIATEYIKETVRDLDPEDAIDSTIDDALDLEDKIQEAVQTKIDSTVEQILADIDLDEMFKSAIETRLQEYMDNNQ